MIFLYGLNELGCKDFSFKFIEILVNCATLSKLTHFVEQKLSPKNNGGTSCPITLTKTQDFTISWLCHNVAAVMPGNLTDIVERVFQSDS